MLHRGRQRVLASLTAPEQSYLATRAFLAANPESTVLHLGCGLDTRVYHQRLLVAGARRRWRKMMLPAGPPS